MSSDQRLNKKIDQGRLLEDLESLSGSELNSFMLKLFKQRARRQSPGDLLKQFHNNRFVLEAQVDTLALRRLELDWLEQVHKQGFAPLTLSPVAPLGSCSVVGEVNQNNMLSALRNTEVVSDATNFMALKVATEHKNADRTALARYATTHRHIRTQAFDNPAFSAHFDLLAMVSGGFDQGSFTFEIQELFRHMHVHHDLLRQYLPDATLYTKLMLKEKAHPFNNFLHQALDKEEFTCPVEVTHQKDAGDYYKLVQFKTFIDLNGEPLNLSDGGVVDWTQKLLSNNKHRLFISASGIELIHKLLIVESKI